MLSQPAPTGNFSDQFDNAIESKRDSDFRQSLQSLEKEIKLRYGEYENFNRHLELVKEITRSLPEFEALASCYTSTLKVSLLKDLQSRLDDKFRIAGYEKPKSIRCPYCQIHIARRWDHFLPSSKYPDFFLYPPNLIYVCEVCNSDIKKNGLVCHPRSTLSPYHDDISAVSLLQCDVQVADEISVSFSICDDVVDGYIAQIARRHFDSYRLNDKFIAESGSKLADLMREHSFARSIIGRPMTQPELTELITGHLDQVGTTLTGPNHWEYSLWTALSGCVALLGFLENRYANL
ncbi:hypothetical protein [Methylorubrum extorquens]